MTPVEKILARAVKYPKERRDQLVAVYIDSRDATDHVVCYWLEAREFSVEARQKLMWKTRRAEPHEQERITRALRDLGEVVTIRTNAHQSYGTREY